MTWAEAGRANGQGIQKRRSRPVSSAPALSKIAGDGAAEIAALCPMGDE
jgi:hypothetical protein